MVWTITDRGPNLDCEGIEELTGSASTRCAPVTTRPRTSRMPDFNITIQKLETGADNTAKVIETIALKTKSGKPVGGLPFSADGFKTEAAYDVNGKLLPVDVNGLDTETLARLPDGSFLIGEEYAPSLVEVAADGTVLKRHVPAGLEGGLQERRRRGGGHASRHDGQALPEPRHRECGGLADGATVYVLMQNPLANPDSDAYKKSANTRLWKLDRATGKLLGEYVYMMDDATSLAGPTTRRSRRSRTPCA